MPMLKKQNTPTSTTTGLHRAEKGNIPFPHRTGALGERLSNNARDPRRRASCAPKSLEPLRLTVPINFSRYCLGKLTMRTCPGVDIGHGGGEEVFKFTPNHAASSSSANSQLSILSFSCLSLSEDLVHHSFNHEVHTHYRSLACSCSYCSSRNLHLQNRAGHQVYQECSDRLCHKDQEHSPYRNEDRHS